MEASSGSLGRCGFHLRHPVGAALLCTAVLRDGAYAAFGKVTEGMDVVNKIAETKTDYNDRPLEEQKLKKVTVETFGVEYEEPEKL